ncbi:MAG: ATP-binding protein [Mesorhizobium sp.]|nr:MAG: ATP-binding protein [Mesorhizobium sp.]TJV37231.1 MAG: ATP-binding protein [Mesorhizobium sp.]
MVKRESWSEQDILDLPPEESDDFDRKGGRLFDEVEDKVLTTIAKALSAFANSGGGSLVLGVKDDGSIDGIPAMKGRATIRDWLEQKAPHLLDYPLADFRVHTVLRGEQSQIPIGREIIVIDVGDSAAAPHQSARDHLYIIARAAARFPPSTSTWTCCGRD